MALPHSQPFRSLVDVLASRAEQTPDVRAFTFLVDGEDLEATVTYAELDRQARAIAAVLQGMRLVGERAVLLYPPGLEFVAAFFGCLYAGVVAVPAYPPDPARLERSLPRLEGIVRDCRPSVVLTTAAVRGMAIGVSMLPPFDGISWVASDDLPEGIEHIWAPPRLEPTLLAMLQYTSGSAGAPKGVMLSHENLVRNLEEVTRAIEPKSGDVLVSWLPLFHDLGLIVKMLGAVAMNMHGVLLSPMHFLQRPYRWLRAISKYGGTFSAGPNFAYDLCVRKVTPEMKASLDLSRWDQAASAAEPIRNETVGRFVAAFASCGFRAAAMCGAYGLAEATVTVAYGRRAHGMRIAHVDREAYSGRRVVRVSSGAADRVDVVGCGKIGPSFDARIVDPATGRALRDGEVGELWLSGPSVGHGYWGRIAESDAVFRARLADDPRGRTYVRTYDLAFIEEDELYIAGRLKDVLIVRGKNHYPQDIETTVTSCDPRLRPGCAAAFAVGDADDVVVVAEIDDGGAAGGPSFDDLMQTISRRVAEAHGIRLSRIAFIPKGTIEKTSSGKIQRQVTRAAFLEGRHSVVASSRRAAPPSAPRLEAR